MVFYYVHPAVLYINKFRVAGLLDEGIDQFIEQVRAAALFICANGARAVVPAG
jgi:hypothetical protein